VSVSEPSLAVREDLQFEPARRLGLDAVGGGLHAQVQRMADRLVVGELVGPFGGVRTGGAQDGRAARLAASRVRRWIMGLSLRILLLLS